MARRRGEDLENEKRALQRQMEAFFAKVDRRAHEKAEERMQRFRGTPEPTTEAKEVDEGKPASPEEQATSEEEATLRALEEEEKAAREEEEKRRKERLQKEKDALRAPFQDLMN